MVQQLQGASVEGRVAHYQELRKAAPPQVFEDFQTSLRMSWIYHDSALEGVVYTQEELMSAIGDEPPEEGSLTPVYDVIKKIYAQLAPEELEGKGQPTYRKDMPLHRLYFHEIAPPEKISYRMRQLVQWMNAAETKRSTHAVRLASKAHVQLLQIYPFPRQSGKVARLVMNLILLRQGYPPVVIHATQRQRYYEALKQSDDAVARVVNEALGASVESAIRFLEEAGVEV